MIKLDRIQLVALTYEAIDELKQSDLYQNYLLTYKAYHHEKNLPLIATFNTEKTRFEEVSKYGKYHPDYEKVRLSYTNAKTTLFQTEEYRNYQDALMKLNFYLRDISRNITSIINECLVSSNEPHACHTKG